MTHSHIDAFLMLWLNYLRFKKSGLEVLKLFHAQLSQAITHPDYSWSSLSNININRIFSMGENYAETKAKELRKVSKGAKIRNRYNQVPHLTQDTNGKVTNSQLDTTNESQEVSPLPAGDQEAHINRRAQRHSSHKAEKTHKRSTKEVPPWNGW